MGENDNAIHGSDIINLYRYYWRIVSDLLCKYQHHLSLRTHVVYIIDNFMTSPHTNTISHVLATVFRSQIVEGLVLNSIASGRLYLQFSSSTIFCLPNLCIFALSLHRDGQLLSIQQNQLQGSLYYAHDTLDILLPSND